MYLDDVQIESEDLKPYKGYRICKSWKVYRNGTRIPKSVVYQVIDENDDWIGDCYTSLADALRFIDDEVVTSSSNVKSSRYVRAESYNYGSAYVIASQGKQWYVLTAQGEHVAGPFYSWIDAQDYVDELEEEY